MPKDLRKEITRLAKLCKQWYEQDLERKETASNNNNYYANGYYGGTSTAFKTIGEMLEITLEETK